MKDNKTLKKVNILTVLIVFSSIILALIIILRFIDSLNLSAKHVDYMEANEITYISDSNGGSSVYCISKNGTVYELNNNVLTEKPDLFGAKEIIVNMQGTFVFCEDGSLFSYDDNTNSKSQIFNPGECKEIVNCYYYFAAILNTDELFVSWDIADENQEYFENAQSKRIPLPTKPVKISAMHAKMGRTLMDTNFMKFVAIVDENNDLWMYGGVSLDENEFAKTIGLRKMPDYGGVDDIAQGCGFGLVYEKQDGQLMHYGYELREPIITFDLYKKDYLLNEIEPNIKINDIVQIKTNNENAVFVDSKNTVYNFFYGVAGDTKFYKQAKFKENVNVYPVNYKIYVISENGDVYVLDNEELGKELSELSRCRH